MGVSVSPLVALVNHSCDPNAVVVFPRSAKDPASQEPEAQVIAIRDISPGEEVSVDFWLLALSFTIKQIFTSYIDTTLPRAQRQEALSATYNFSCQCELCSRPPAPDPREALACPKTCGGACPFPSEGTAFYENSTSKTYRFCRGPSDSLCKLQDCGSLHRFGAGCLTDRSRSTTKSDPSPVCR